VLQAPFGSLSDRVGRFLPVVLGSIAYRIVTIGVGVAPVYPVAAALMVLVGVCGALMAPATMALVTDLVEAEALGGAAMGLFNVFGSLGFLAGFLIGGSATDLFGYTPAFLAVGGLNSPSRWRCSRPWIDRARATVSPRTRRRDWAVALG